MLKKDDFKIVLFLSMVLIFFLVAFWVKTFNSKISVDDYLIYGLSFVEKAKVNDFIPITRETDFVRISGYDFEVSSISSLKYSYSLVLDDIGICKKDKMFDRSELSYALFLNDEVIASGLLDSLNNDLLHEQLITKGDKHSYSFKVWADGEKNESFIDKYYCYNILLEI